MAIRSTGTLYLDAEGALNGPKQRLGAEGSRAYSLKATPATPVTDQGFLHPIPLYVQAAGQHRLSWDHGDDALPAATRFR